MFGKYVENGIYPTRTYITEMIKKCPELQERSPDTIVSHLQHAMKKNRQ